MTTTVRLPLRVEQTLAAYCAESKRTKSEVIVELLEQRFLSTQTESTPYQLAQEAGFIGCIAGKSATAGKTAGSKERVAAAIRRKHGKKHGKPAT